MTRSLEILVGADLPQDENSGAAGTVMATNESLSALGHHVTAFWSDSMKRRISHGNLHYVLELPRAYRKEVRKRMLSRRFDVVQLSQPYAYLAGRMLQRAPSGPLAIWRSHGLEAKVHDALQRYGLTNGSFVKTPFRKIMAARLEKIQRLAVRWCDGIIVPCSDDKHYLVTRFGASPERVCVIWHGVPDSFLDRKLTHSEDRWNRILHVSQMSMNKAPHLMNEIATDILRRSPQATMTWVSPAAKHQDIRRGIPSFVQDRISFVDWMPRESLIELYDSHGIFVFPTLAEGAAKTVMEAMARGMCVVSSDTSGPSDYITSGRNGRLSPVGDASAMADAAVSLLERPSLCERYGKAARATAQDFRWIRCARQHVDFYKDLSS